MLLWRNLSRIAVVSEMNAATRMIYRLQSVVLLGFLMVPVAWAQSAAEKAAALRDVAGNDANLHHVRRHLDEGASPNAKSRSGWTAVHVAANGTAMRNLEVLFANGGNPNVRDNDGNTPLHLAANLSGVPVRLAREATELMRILRDAGANPNIGNNEGDTPLHLAARTYGSHDSSGVEVLLRAGASPNMANKRGNMPLHEAVKANGISAVDALLAGGANPRALGAGLTPLLLFVRDGEDNGRIVSLLIRAGANPDRKAPNGDTPLHTAIREGGNRGKEEVVDALLAGGADPCIEDVRGFIPYNIAREGGNIHRALDRADGFDSACDSKGGGKEPKGFAALWGQTAESMMERPEADHLATWRREVEAARAESERRRAELRRQVEAERRAEWERQAKERKQAEAPRRADDRKQEAQRVVTEPKCAETPVCKTATATIDSSLSEIKKAEDMSMTNSSLLVALINRIAIGCTRVCAESEEMAMCRQELEEAIASLQAAYEDALKTAISTAADESYPKEFDRDPENSRFLRDTLPKHGVRIVGGIDSCGK